MAVSERASVRLSCFALPLATLLAAPVRAAAEEPVRVEETSRDATLERARRIVDGARQLFQAGHYSAALAEFTRAYDTLEGHPRQYWVLYNLAVCQQRLFRYDLALALYEEYLRRAPSTEPDLGEVRAVIRTLRSLLGTLDVQTSVPAEVWVDERRLGTAPGKFLVPAGRLAVELRATGYESQRIEVRLPPEQTRTLRRELRRLSSITGPSQTYFWVAAGASAASAAAGATFGILALRSRGEGVDRAELHLDTSEQSERARKQALAADACFGGAVVFGAAATVLYLLTDWSPPERGESVVRVAFEPRKRLELSLDLEF